jgi:anti-sigma B factor antagonist
MSDLQLATRPLQNGVVYITLKGFLDAHTFEQLEQIINDLFDQNIYRMIVDLQGLDYISSAGAGVFIGAISAAQENDGNIVLMRPSPNVKEVFDLLGLTQVFSFANDLETAMKHFA